MPETHIELLSAYGEVSSSFGGAGSVVLADGEERDSSRLVAGQLKTGETLLLCYFPGDDLWGRSIAGASFRDETAAADVATRNANSETNYLPQAREAGTYFAIRLNELVVTHQSKAASKVVYGLASLLLSGRFEVETPVGTIEVVPVAGYGEVSQRLKTLRHPEVSALAIWHPPDGSHELPHDYLDDICAVLSVARGTKVQWLWFQELDSGDGLLRTTYQSRVTKRFSALSPIDYRNPCDTQEWLNQVLPGFRELDGRYGLKQGAVDAYVDAKQEGDYLQVRGAKTAVAVEMLKQSFVSAGVAESAVLEGKSFESLREQLRAAVNQVLVEAKVNRKSRGRMLANLRGLNGTPFRIQLGKMLKKIGLRIDQSELDLFVKSRNKLVHECRFLYEVSAPSEMEEWPHIKSVVDEWLHLVHLLDRIFMALLGYDGPYLDWSERENPVRRERLVRGD